MISLQLPARAPRFLFLLAGLTLIAGPQTLMAQMKAPDFLVTKKSAYGFDETLNRLREAIEQENLMIVHEINPQQMLRMVGVKRAGMRQILFFHPRYMKQILEANPNAGIEPPLKLIVMESPRGVMVRYEKPAHQFAPYQGLDAVVADLTKVYDRILKSIQN